MHYFIVDFSFSEEHGLKIFEQGLGHLSGFAGLEALDGTYLHDKIDQEYLKPELGDAPDFYFIDFIDPLGCINILSTNGGDTYQYAKLPSDQTANLMHHLKTLRGQDRNRIAMLLDPKCKDESIRAAYNEFLSWQEEHPNSPVVSLSANTTFSESCMDKGSFHLVAEGSPIYPETLVSNEVSQEETAEIHSFLESHQNEYFVLKPKSETCATGVKVLHRDQVVSAIQIVRKGNDSDPYWRANSNAGFILQACYRSDPVVAADNKAYIPTGRVVIACDDRKQDPKEKFKCIGAYWKLAETEYDASQADTQTNANTISKTIRRSGDASGSPCSAEIAPDLLQRIMAQFYEHFPTIYEKTIRSSTAGATDERLEEANNAAGTASQPLIGCVTKELLADVCSLDPESDPLDPVKEERSSNPLLDLEFTTLESAKGWSVAAAAAGNSPADIFPLICRMAHPEYDSPNEFLDFLRSHSIPLSGRYPKEITPDELCEAIHSGNTNLVKFLIETGIVNIDKPNTDGSTPLTLAAASDAYGMVFALAYQRPNVNLPNAKGDTPLTIAAASNVTYKASFLFQKGADVNLPNAKGDTPLIIAIKNNKLEMAYYLITLLGADVNKPDTEGTTPLKHALNLGEPGKEIAELLKKNSAREVNLNGNATMAGVGSAAALFNKAGKHCLSGGQGVADAETAVATSGGARKAAMV